MFCRIPKEICMASVPSFSAAFTLASTTWAKAWKLTIALDLTPDPNAADELDVAAAALPAGSVCSSAFIFSSSSCFKIFSFMAFSTRFNSFLFTIGCATALLAAPLGVLISVLVCTSSSVVGTGTDEANAVSCLEVTAASPLNLSTSITSGSASQSISDAAQSITDAASLPEGKLTSAAASASTSRAAIRLALPSPFFLSFAFPLPPFPASSA